MCVAHIGAIAAPLGGDLRNRLRRIYGQRYQTWGLPGSNTIHVARRSEYTFPPVEAQTVLFISAGTEFLRWGFSLPTAGKSLVEFSNFFTQWRDDAPTAFVDARPPSYFH